MNILYCHRLDCTQLLHSHLFHTEFTAFTDYAGASLTASYDKTIEQEKVDTDSKTYQITVAGSLTATSTADSTYTVMLAYFGNSLASAVSSGTAYPLVSGMPADGCSALSYPYKLPGKVVLLSRGNCTFQTKVWYQSGLPHSITAQHHSLASWHSITAQHHGTASRHSITAQHHSTASWHSITAQHHGTAS